MLKVGISGFGKVGKAIYNLSNGRDDIEITSIFNKYEDSYKDLSFDKEIFTTDIDKFFNSSELIIDFSNEIITNRLLKHNIKDSKPLVIGTTSLSSSSFDMINSTNHKIFYSANFSIGVALLRNSVKILAEKLPNFDIEIIEKHHRDKLDAPSGTALAIANDLADIKNGNIVKTRSGTSIKREKKDITLHAIRGGDIVGEHTVGFYNDGEYFEFKHSVTNRDIFAKGSIQVALWLKDQDNGSYNLLDYLGL